MPYALAQGDIVQLVVRYAQADVVEMMNVLHYRYTSETPAADGRAAIDTFIQHFGNVALTGSFPARWSALSVDTVVIDKFEGQKVYPVRYAKVTYNVAIGGELVEAPLPGFVQYAITKRGDVAQKYAVGGIRVPGLAPSWENNGNLAVAALPHAENLATTIRAILTDTAGRTWQPVVYRRLNPGSSVDVVETQVHTALRSQRSRINFRGI